MSGTMLEEILSLMISNFDSSENNEAIWSLCVMELTAWCPAFLLIEELMVH